MVTTMDLLCYTAGRLEDRGFPEQKRKGVAEVKFTISTLLPAISFPEHNSVPVMCVQRGHNVKTDEHVYTDRLMATCFIVSAAGVAAIRHKRSWTAFLEHAL